MKKINNTKSNTFVPNRTTTGTTPLCGNKVECPHKDECSSYPYKCDTCRHNSNKKKDYYSPDVLHPYTFPHIWYDWYNPYDNQTSVHYG